MDLVIRNGTVVTAGEISQADVGIEAGLVKQIGQIGMDLGPAAKEIDAKGCYLFPGGVDVHTHVDIELMGHRSIDDFYSGTVSAACGGVTSIVDYALPEPGQSIQASVEAWQKKAQDKAIIDYGLHPAILDPTQHIIDEMADAVAEGHTRQMQVMWDGLRTDTLQSVATDSIICLSPFLISGSIHHTAINSKQPSKCDMRYAICDMRYAICDMRSDGTYQFGGARCKIFSSLNFYTTSLIFTHCS